MGKIIAVCNQKGGAGKTTTVLGLALAMEQHNQRVGIIDRDPQSTVTKAINRLRKAGLTKTELPIDKLHEFDFILVDTPPALHEEESPDDETQIIIDLNPETKKAVRAADHVIVVTAPTPADLWSTRDTVKLIPDYQKPGATLHLLFNQVVRGTKEAANLDGVADQLGVQKLKREIHRSIAIGRMMQEGWPALSGDQRHEFKQLAIEIEAL